MILHLNLPKTSLIFKTINLFNKRSLSGLNLWHEEISTEIKHKIDNYWRPKLQTETFNEHDNTKEKYYVLSMFPYPSGFLHMGHVRVYTISDVIARFQRMNGKNVIHPIGWDAFGLPAENAAIERQIPPQQWTTKNIEHMKGQLQRLGCSFEWYREFATCQPEYYRWTQELFLKLYTAGLVYQKEAIVNWDPIDQTVLADEQVDENGCSWRSGAKVQHKPLKQWFIKTTNYAKDLLDGLNDEILQDWRDVIKLQKHWIGDCNGVNFEFKLIGKNDDFIKLWTPIPEFINEMKFVVINDKHILAKCEGNFVNSDIKKLNIEIENPLNQQKIPIFVTNDFGYLPDTDCFVGIPSVCEKSAKFADILSINYQKIDAVNIPENEREQLQTKICQQAKQLNAGGYWSSAKLRDWLISRQRFWGTPIPIIHCKNCGVQPVPKQHLPVELPKLDNISEKHMNLLLESTDWIHVECPKCGNPAKRETDTMDTFVDSSWYYLRYLDSKNSHEMFDVDKIKKILPVDLYIGGKEHAVLHLYYARFISHFLHSIGMVPEREPFKRLLVQGMVMGRSYRVKETGQYLPENQIKIIDLKHNKAVTINDNKPVVISWEKMSKSKQNGVDPDDMFKEYSVDTVNLDNKLKKLCKSLINCLDSLVSFPITEENLSKITTLIPYIILLRNCHEAFPGILNWQKRLWLTIRDFIEHRKNPPPPINEEQFKKHDNYMYDSRNYYLKGATFNYCGSQQHSVALSKQQGLTNSIRKMPPAIFAYSLQFERALASQIILLAPMAPHFASELWSGFLSAPNRLNHTGEIDWQRNVLEQKWPLIDLDYNMDLICKINGEEICKIKVSKCDLEKLTKDQAVEMALKRDEIQKELSSRPVLNSSYIVNDDYNSIINIKTNFVRKEKPEKRKIKN